MSSPRWAEEWSDRGKPSEVGLPFYFVAIFILLIMDCYARSKLAGKQRMIMRISAPQNLTLNVMLEQTTAGQSVASVLELPGYQVEAATEEEAIAGLQQIIIERFAKAKVIPLEIPVKELTTAAMSENPWTEFIGMFEGDPEFAALAAELRAERELDLDDVA